MEWQPGMEPYYPVNDNRNAVLYQQYKLLAEKEKNVFFGGRLTEYKYYDMAPTIEQALRLANEQFEK
jgi:UDP-galactopyranose mutase